MISRFPPMTPLPKATWAKELFQPIPNRPKTGFLGNLRFNARLFFDFQVASVHRSLKAFFATFHSGKVLEVGGGLSPYRHLIRSKSYWSLDPYRLEREFGYSSKSVKYDSVRFPFKDGSFDVLFHTEVMEHVLDTHAFLGECNRVLKGGGSMLFTVPFSARFHYQPYDYWRFTPSSLESLCATNGFSNVRIEARGDVLSVILNKLISLFAYLSMGYRRGDFRGVVQTLAVGLPAALLLPAMALAGHILMRLAWLADFGDCLGYTVTCVKTAR